MYTRYQSDSDLAGSKSQKSKWVSGYNGVYENTNGPEPYRVAIKTSEGWITYGHFFDRDTAAYIANIAILSTQSHGLYNINKGLIPDKKELQYWLSSSQNHVLMHDQAKAEYKECQEQYESNKYEHVEANEYTYYSNLTTSEFYVMRIESDSYTSQQLMEIKDKARVGGSIHTAAIRKLQAYKVSSCVCPHCEEEVIKGETICPQCLNKV